MKNILCAICIVLLISSCKKSDFLNIKPSTSIIGPKTIGDFQQILENWAIMRSTGGLAQVSADDHETSYANYLVASITERNAYIWSKELYQGDINIEDWNALYKEIFSANVVLEGIAKSDSLNTIKGQYLKGWALFARAYAFYDLTRNFCTSYDSSTADTDLGIPLRLSASINYNMRRNTLQESFDQILTDLNTCLSLLPVERPALNLNRPSKLAVYALLSRIYLDMRNYQLAEQNADNALTIYSSLIDYNTVNKTSATPFSLTNAELIYNTLQVTVYASMTLNSIFSRAVVSPALISLYQSNDLRLSTYFDLSNGFYTKKKGYNGFGSYHFTGLATDELYLIKAECLARKGETSNAMDKLNQLLVKRYDNTSIFVPLNANSAADALLKIIQERRKELVWRGLRWHDLKRLNKEGAGIILTRQLNGATYTLPPNDARYVFPIPDDEIASSGIQQNIR